MKKIFPLLLLLAILAGSWIAYRMYNKPHRNPDTESAIILKATELFQNFESNETEANVQYLDKVLEVRGKVAELTTNQDSIPIVVLETDDPVFGVRCTMEGPALPVEVGDTVSIRGICTGYLSDVIIVNGKLVTEKE